MGFDLVFVGAFAVLVVVVVAVVVVAAVVTFVVFVVVVVVVVVVVAVVVVVVVAAAAAAAAAVVVVVVVVGSEFVQEVVESGDALLEALALPRLQDDLARLCRLVQRISALNLPMVENALRGNGRDMVRRGDRGLEVGGRGRE